LVDLVPLAFDARTLLEQFAREMQDRQREAGPLLASALSKARGQALRLSLVLELLWWCAEEGLYRARLQIAWCLQDGPAGNLVIIGATPEGKRSCSVSPTARAKVPRIGGSCCSICSVAGQ
jgi:hypothetical protein